MAENINLEQDIARIEQELAAKRAALEQQKMAGEINELPHEKETLHEIVGEQMRQPGGALPEKPVEPIPTPPPMPKPGENIPSYMTEALNPSVKQLIDIAFSKSISDAISAAKSSGNAALIDAFHDALVDELYNNLVEYRKIKKL